MENLTKSISFEKAFVIVVLLHVVGAIGLYTMSSIRGHFRRLQREAHQQETTAQLKENQLRSTWTNVREKPRIVATAPKPKPTPRIKKPAETKSWIDCIPKIALMKSSTKSKSVNEIGLDLKKTVEDLLAKHRVEKQKEEQAAREAEQSLTEKRLRMNRIRQAMQFQNAEEEQLLMKIINEADKNVDAREVISSRVLLR